MDDYLYQGKGYLIGHGHSEFMEAVIDLLVRVFDDYVHFSLQRGIVRSIKLGLGLQIKTNQESHIISY